MLSLSLRKIVRYQSFDSWNQRWILALMRFLLILSLIDFHLQFHSKLKIFFFQKYLCWFCIIFKEIIAFYLLWLYKLSAIDLITTEDRTGHDCAPLISSSNSCKNPLFRLLWVLIHKEHAEWMAFAFYVLQKRRNEKNLLPYVDTK